MSKLSEAKKSLFNKKGLRILYFLGFILALSTAIPTYIESNYIKEFVSAEKVGLFFIVSNIVTFLLILIYPGLIERFKNYRVSQIVLGCNFISLIAMFFANSPFTLYIAFIFLMSSFNLIWINMDIFVENFTAADSVGRTRSTYFTFMNLGWVLAPIIASYFIKGSNYRPVYLLAAALLIPFYIIFIEKGRNLKDKTKYEKNHILKTIKKTFQTKDVRGIFSLAILLHLFYSLAVVYMPIHLHENIGLSWSQLGIAFSFMLLPFILFEIPAGIIADKYLGEKEIMTLGFTILIISLVLFFSVQSTSIIVWGLILFFSRTGAALVESMREAYFFKIVEAKEVGLINFFRTAQPLGYLIGTGLGTIILVFYPIQYVFLILAVLMSSCYYFLWVMKDTK
ncbi:MAG: MFS transporter [Candidatus Falkowbacteria bacterium]